MSEIVLVFRPWEEEKEETLWHLHIVVATRIYRWLAKAPLWFSRFGLGWILGNRLLQMTHRGRRSGLLRQTVLEVPHDDPQTREALIVGSDEQKAIIDGKGE